MNQPLINLKSRFNGKTVTILGAGISNMPSARLLASLGTKLTVRDAKSEASLGERAAELRDLGARLVCGPDYLSGIDGDFILRSPGIRPDCEEITAAVSAGSILTSETELFLEFCPGTVIAVTGSAGKSTTTSVIGLFLSCAEKVGGGRAFAGGNLGDPLLYRIGDMDEKSMVAAELSSFQLMTVDAPVKVAVITNVTENHLNWHTGMEEYIDAKARLLRHAEKAVLNYSCLVCRSLGERLSCPVYWFSAVEEIPEEVLRAGDRAYYTENGYIIEARCEYGDLSGSGVSLVSDKKTEVKKRSILPISDILLPGVHNVGNYMTAIAAVNAADANVTDEMIRSVARTFGGVPHRMELVRMRDGISYYNSSIDSTPERTRAALSTMTGRGVELILGGSDKHISFDPLADAVLSHGGVRAAVLYGETAEKIEKAFADKMDSKKTGINNQEVGQIDVEIIRAPGETYREQFENAVQIACGKARPGDAVILSPACASFDAFENFERRGDSFKEIVNGLK